MDYLDDTILDSVSNRVHESYLTKDNG